MDIMNFTIFQNDDHAITIKTIDIANIISDIYKPLIVLP